MLRLINTFRPKTADDDLAREVAAHLALLEDEYRRRGLTPTRRGSLHDVRSAASPGQGPASRRALVRWLDDSGAICARARACSGEIRVSPRWPSSRSRSASAPTTAIFSVVHGVLMRPLPWPEPDRLVLVFGPTPTDPVSSAPREGWLFPLETSTGCVCHSRAFPCHRLHADHRTLTGRVTPFGCRLAGLGGAVPDARRSAAAWPRFRASAEAAGSDAVVVLSHAMWQRYFNADVSLIGQLVTLDGRGRTLSASCPADSRKPGIAPPDPQAQFWVPYKFRRRPTPAIA